ncbi:MAG: succinylglutamate desuccinylase [Euryarchaeota archaeon]|nr:succinylglutamate desuccinylase [Euryarchaeota archaeon]
MAFENSKDIFRGSMSLISYETGGNIEKNRLLNENIPKNQIICNLIRLARHGTPLLKIGEGNPRIMGIAGVHGNELPPQIASLWLIDELIDCDINGTLYVIPFAIPYATMENSRRFKGIDMNRIASKGGYVSNNIVKAIKMLNIDAVADFHSTKPKSNPGRESVFCSKNPSYQSFEIARYITNATSSELIGYDHAGTLYTGALEDECNLAGIPAVTCEVVSENGEIDEGSPQRSYLQMISYLEYFKLI